LVDIDANSALKQDHDIGVADVMQPLLTVYYDHSCPLCRAEIQALRQADVLDEVAWLDCSAADFQCAAADADGIDRAAMMEALHLRDRSGRWLIGVDAFATLYRQLGLHGLANPWALPGVRGVLRWLYPWIARHRQGLSRLGVNALFGWWIARAARRAAQRKCRLVDAGGCPPVRG
jgi:predicted DCC family thiol-disulfide oxidoreductase YuxK